jgi:riboflavin kinase/FMN adenylyltransferase
MNFPTANLVPGELIHPKKGVYAIRARYTDKWNNGIANFGERPTVDGKRLLLEAHLFEFNQDIYGKELTVEFLTFIREEKKFDNFALLTEQVQKDIQLVKSYHSEH